MPDVAAGHTVKPYDDGDRFEEPEFARKVGVTPRAQRARRQRGDSSPNVKDGKKVFYSWMKYLQHLEKNEHKPTRKSA